MLSSVSNGLEISCSPATKVTIPQLSYVGGDFTISGNPYLEDVELDRLINVQGSLEMKSNDVLANISGLPRLSEVGSNLELIGAFNELVCSTTRSLAQSTDRGSDSVDLPALSNVGQAIVIQSTGSVDCSDVPSTLAQGSYSCKANINTANGATDSDRKAGGRFLSAGAEAGIALGTTTIALVGILAATGYFASRRRRISQSRTSAFGHGATAATEHESGQTGVEGDRKQYFEMENYNVESHYDGSSQKELIHRGAEMGRPLSGSHPGPEGRHKMFNSKDLPAAHEFPGDAFDRT